MTIYHHSTQKLFVLFLWLLIPLLTFAQPSQSSSYRLLKQGDFNLGIAPDQGVQSASLSLKEAVIGRFANNPQQSQAYQFLPGIIHQEDNSLTYCNENLYTTGCTNNDFISMFLLEEINNINTGCSPNGYGNYQHLSTVLARGQSYTVTLTAGYQNQYVSIWIDWNGNGLFDQEEAVLTGGHIVQSGTPTPFEIAIPADTPEGAHRMRVRMVYNNIPEDPCATYQLGETEDYTVVVYEEGYCTANLYEFGCSMNDAINSFVLADISNINSGCSPDGYGDFTHLGTELVKGNTYQIQHTSLFNDQYVSIWIDWNSNYTFDPEEKVLSNAYINQANIPFNFEITIPQQAPSGSFTMRVRQVHHYEANDPCQQYEMGETEDYTVHLAAPSYCTTDLYTEGCGFGDYINDFILADLQHTATGCSPNGYGDYTALIATLTQGQNHSLTINTAFQNQYMSIWIDLNDDFSFDENELLLSDAYLAEAGISYDFNLLIPEDAATGNHRMRVRLRYGQAASDPCATYEYGEVHDYTAVIEADNSPEYCITNLYTNSCASGHYIDTFELNEIANTNSGCSPEGYGDFTHLLTNLTKGETYTLNLMSVKGDMYAAAWIDWDLSYTFDAGEQILFNAPMPDPQQLYAFQVTIPAEAATGTFRLRVRIGQNIVVNDPCQTYSYGEAEDYSVKLIEGTVACAAPTDLSANLINNLSVKLLWQAGSNETNWHVSYGPKFFNPDTEGTLVENIMASTYTIEGLQPSTTYHAYVRAVCSAGQQSSWTGPVAFETGINTTSPSLSTLSVYDITVSTAMSGGDISSNGGSVITSKGLVWSTLQLPTINNNQGITNEGGGSTDFSTMIAGLQASTTYYVRAYATNAIGTAYGIQRSFTTLSDEVCTPAWEPTPNLQFNMQLVAQIQNNGQPSMNPNDVLGAFVNGECRGLASPDPSANGLIFLTVGSDLAQGEQVELRIWNAENCSECDAIPGFAFQSQSELGTFIDPYQVQCGVMQELSFGEGYTWFSSNVNPGSLLINDFFSGLNACYDDRIIGQTSFALYTGNSWIGSLSNLDMQQMYRMKLCNTQNFVVSGSPAPIEPIELNPGYTWLSYQPQQCMTVAAAMAGLSPGPSYDDRIIGQNSFALYTGVQWIGSLTELCPGEGYILKLANGSTLNWPHNNKTSMPLTSVQPSYSPTGVYPLTNYQHTMMVVAQLQLPDGSITTNPKDVVYAYIDGELRGMGSPTEVSEGRILISIGENSEEEKDLSFKVWIDEQSSLYELGETIGYLPLAEVGDFANPILLQLDMMVNIHESGSNQQIGNLRPNPATDQLFIPVNLSENSNLHISVTDAKGLRLKEFHFSHLPSGRQELRIDIDDLPPAVYLIQTVINTGQKQQTNVQRLVVN